MGLLGVKKVVISLNSMKVLALSILYLKLNKTLYLKQMIFFYKIYGELITRIEFLIG